MFGDGQEKCAARRWLVEIGNEHVYLNAAPWNTRESVASELEGIMGGSVIDIVDYGEVTVPRCDLWDRVDKKDLIPFDVEFDEEDWSEEWAEEE